MWSKRVLYGGRQSCRVVDRGSITEPLVIGDKAVLIIVKVLSRRPPTIPCDHCKTIWDPQVQRHADV